MRAVHLPRRPTPVEPERQRQPARLRAQLFLADVVGPAAARLADTAAHDQHVDQPAVVHVVVEPVVHRGADDDHRAAVRLVGVARELTRHLDDLGARHAGDLFLPGRRAGHIVVVVCGDVTAAEAAIEAVLRQQQVVHRGDLALSPPRERAGGAPACALLRMSSTFTEVPFLVLDAAEVREADVGETVAGVRPGSDAGACRGRWLSRCSMFHLALFAPAETDGAVGRDQLAAGLVEGDRLPLGVVGSRRARRKVAKRAGSARRPGCRHRAVPASPASACRSTAGIIAEIRRRLLEVELAQHDVAEGERQCRVGALLRDAPRRRASLATSA